MASKVPKAPSAFDTAYGTTPSLFEPPAPPAAAPAPGEVQVRGRISRVIYENVEDSFFIFAVQPFGTTSTHDQVKVKGYAHRLAVSQEVDCTGEWESNRNPRYKDELTLKASAISEHVPTTVAGLRRMMEHGFVKGIGPKWGEALLDRFGEKLLDVAERQPIRLLEVPGFGEVRARAFEQAVKEKRAVPRIMAFLAEIGLGPGLSHRVFKDLGVDAVRQIKADPYALTKVQQIGFSIADRVARQIGISPESHTRIEAAARAVLMKESENGSTAVPVEKFFMELSNVLRYTPDKGTLGGTVEVPMKRIADVVDQALSKGEVARARLLADGTKAISLPEFLHQEQRIGQNLARLSRSVTRGLRSVDLSSPKFAHLDEGQREAARMALTSNVSVITGRPGCGKTTVTKSIIQALQDAGLEYLACGPTGRAAKRFMEATGFEACTMHRALESKGTGSFGRDENNPFSANFIIADEQSMSDTYISHRMLRAVASGTQLLYVGDVDQLPSIGAGAVLKDIIQSGQVPVSVLTKIHRQAAGSDIITNAHRIIEGQVPESRGPQSDFQIRPSRSGEDAVQLVIDQYQALRAKGFEPEDIQILTPMRKKTELGANELNRRLKDILNPGEPHNSIKRGKYDTEVVFSPGDRVMQVANNKDLGIYNGDIGYILSIDKRSNEILVDFSGDHVALGVDDLDDLDLAYATTIHKSQGSEFPAIIIPMAKSHWNMWDRNLLYTAVTRGKEEVVLTGDTYMLKTVVGKQNASQRLTGLQTEIEGAFSALRTEFGETAEQTRPRQEDAPRRRMFTGAF